MQTALLKNGKALDAFSTVLDFGCGCARTLRWFAGSRCSWDLYGTDIDVEAISWCRTNLDVGTFGVNKPLPPLNYPDQMFDLIFAVSVFTHLGEDRQLLWLEELRRIARPGATVLLTVHGHHAWKSLPRTEIMKIERDGFIFINSRVMKGIFPDWYQVAYHSKEYVLDRYSPYFEILDYIPQGLNRHQDLVVLQRT